MIKINQTPVTTSRNFNINNIGLDDFEFLEKIPEFKNIEIKNENSKLQIEQNTSNINLAYGLSNNLTEQVNQNANQKLKLIINSKTNKETEICFKLDKENSTLVDNIEIVANENTKATVIIKYEEMPEIKGYHNSVIKTIAKNGADIKIIVVNLLNLDSTNLISIENLLEEKSKINFCIIDFGGKESVTNYYSNLLGNNSENYLNTIYLGKQNQLFDLNYIAELRGKKTNVNIEVQGALKDTAKKHFKGTIDFKQGCKKAKGNENEACMLLSDTAKSLALPMLLCSEEEVEGNHSTATGKVGDKELFYIMSRGFSQKEAMKLLVRARFNEVLENIKNENLKEEILNEIDNRLN